MSRGDSVFMPDASASLSDNPYFQNGLVLDLLAWRIISLEKANTMWIDPQVEARRVTQSNRQRQIDETVARWQQQYQSSGHRVALKWPHCVYPVLTEGFTLDD